MGHRPAGCFAKRGIRIAAICALMLFSARGHGQASQPIQDSALRRGFVSPPAQAKLRCYWWWLNGNTTKATITSDLTEMSRKGFGGVLLVDANGSNQNGNQGVPPGPLFGSSAWVKLYLHALKVAASLHLEVTVNITSGWNLGGPAVTPADAMKILTWSRQAVDSTGFDGMLPMPTIKNGFYRQIAVLTYPLVHGAALAGASGDTRQPIRELTLKSATAEAGFSMPSSLSLLTDVPPKPGEEDTLLSRVIDISSQVDAAGHLHWSPPTSGVWEVLRIGYTDNGARVSTSSGAWQGLAIDYLDRHAFDTYWGTTVAPLLEAAQPYLENTLVHLATDSWEMGGTNWTGRFAETFRRNRGYDPIPYLPVVAGRIVDDRTTSNLFLSDLRRTLGDLVTDHYDHFAERARHYGLGLECESGGPHGAPIDALETFRSSAVPQTEYWAQSTEHRTLDQGRFFTKEAASAANIYGKKFAAQEGMTSIGPQWSESPATDLKPSFDQGLTEGMNRLVWHEFTSSPAAYGLPGNEYFAGTHMNPRVTWWAQSENFFRYLNRAQWMLQQGHAVSDVLFFNGGQVPSFVRLKRDDPAHVLPGYDYDVTNEDALLRTLTFRDGGLSTASGNRYRLLALPVSGRLSLRALERIAAYVEQGGTVAGRPPFAPLGIIDATAQQRFAALRKAMWSGCGDAPHRYGRGLVYCSNDGRRLLEILGVLPDFEDSSKQLDFVHRATASTDIYFIRNPYSRPLDTMISLRVAGKTPELWNALDGSMTLQGNFISDTQITRMPLHLEPFGSIFVVFSRPEGLHVVQVRKANRDIESVVVTGNKPTRFELRNAAAGDYRLRLSDGSERTQRVPPLALLDLPPSQWSLRFEPGRGAPAQAQALREFRSWSDSPIPDIRYFAGTATYHTQLRLELKRGAHYFINLSQVHEIATVLVNGHNAGTLWAMPYRLDLTAFLRPGSNRLDIAVTNLWPNRIIGDAQPSTIRTYTKTNIRKYTADSPLLASGLIGQVTLEMSASSGP